VELTQIITTAIKSFNFSHNAKMAFEQDYFTVHFITFLC